MVKDIVWKAQEFIDKVKQKKIEEEAERLKQVEIKRLADLEKARKLEEEKKSVQPEEATKPKSGPVVSKGKAVKHAKRKNIVKKAAVPIDLGKIDKKKKEIAKE